MDTAAPSKPKRERGATIGVLFVIALIALVIVLDLRRRDAEKKLMELSMQMEQSQPGGANQAQNREAAKQIIEKVGRHFVMPTGVEPTVATIVDVSQLRSKNAFYNKAKNGDSLIVLPERAILYDPVADKIIDVVPVQVQPTAAPEPKAGN